MKRWMMPFAGAVALALSASALEVVRSFPDVSTVVVRLDMAKLNAVPIVKEMRGSRLDPMIATAQSWTGIDLNSVTRVWVAVERKEQAVMVLEGQFDAARIRDALTRTGKARFVERQKVLLAVLLPDDKRPGESNLGVLLDSGTAVFGRPDLVDKFLGASQNGGPGLGQEKLAKLAGFTTSPALLDIVVLALPTEQAGGNPFLANVAGGRGRLEYRQGADVQVEVSMKQADMAEPFQKMLDGFLAMYKMMADQQQAKTPPQLRQLLDGLTITVAGGHVVLHAFLDEDSLNRIVRQKVLDAPPPPAAAGAAVTRPAQVPAPAATAAPAPAPAP